MGKGTNLMLFPGQDDTFLHPCHWLNHMKHALKHNARNLKTKCERLEKKYWTNAGVWAYSPVQGHHSLQWCCARNCPRKAVWCCRMHCECLKRWTARICLPHQQWAQQLQLPIQAQKRTEKVGKNSQHICHHSKTDKCSCMALTPFDQMSTYSASEKTANNKHPQWLWVSFQDRTSMRAIWLLHNNEFVGNLVKIILLMFIFTKIDQKHCLFIKSQIRWQQICFAERNGAPGTCPCGRSADPGRFLCCRTVSPWWWREVRRMMDVYVWFVLCPLVSPDLFLWQCLQWLPSSCISDVFSFFFFVSLLCSHSLPYPRSMSQFTLSLQFQAIQQDWMLYCCIRNVEHMSSQDDGCSAFPFPPL